MNKTEARAIMKCLQKKDMTPEETVALDCYSAPLIHQIQPCLFYMFHKLRSHLFDRQFGNKPCCRGVPGGPECSLLPWGDSMLEHHWTKCFDVKGELYRKIVKSCLDCAIPFLERLRTFLMTLISPSITLHRNHISSRGECVGQYTDLYYTPAIESKLRIHQSFLRTF